MVGRTELRFISLLEEVAVPACTLPPVVGWMRLRERRVATDVLRGALQWRHGLAPPTGLPVLTGNPNRIIRRADGFAGANRQLKPENPSAGANPATANSALAINAAARDLEPAQIFFAA